MSKIQEFSWQENQDAKHWVEFSDSSNPFSMCPEEYFGIFVLT